MKKISALLIVLSIILALQAPAYAYHIVGLSNFEKVQTYSEGVFNDVAQTDWYAQNVKSVYEYGLMAGVGNANFNPEGNITIAESVALLARIHSIYEYGVPTFGETSDDDAWYSIYVQYATERELIRNYTNYDVTAIRAQFAKILAASINPLDFEEINWIDDGAIPDVPTDADYADAVYMLYRAGVLAGSDDAGSFNPNSTITRAEAAAVITRIIDPNLRQTTELNGNY